MSKAEQQHREYDFSRYGPSKEDVVENKEHDWVEKENEHGTFKRCKICGIKSSTGNVPYIPCEKRSTYNHRKNRRTKRNTSEKYNMNGDSNQ